MLAWNVATEQRKSCIQRVVPRRAGLRCAGVFSRHCLDAHRKECLGDAADDPWQ